VCVCVGTRECTSMGVCQSETAETRVFYTILHYCILLLVLFFRVRALGSTARNNLGTLGPFSRSTGAFIVFVYECGVKQERRENETERERERDSVGGKPVLVL